MSKKKNPKRMPPQPKTDGKVKKAKRVKEKVSESKAVVSQKPISAEENAPDVSKKKSKGIIIAAVSVLVAAAIILSGIFILKPAIEKNREPSTTAAPLVTEPLQDGERYAYVNYRGLRMPKEFADILMKAKSDSEAAVKKYGVALTIGDFQISKSEFHLNYRDQYSYQLNLVSYSEQQNGVNRTGYDLYALPDEQDCLNKGYTWAEKFTREAISTIKQYYGGFESAVEAGLELSEDAIAATMMNYESVEGFAELLGKTPDETVVQTYTDGVTYAMYAARSIMMMYSSEYDRITQEQMRDGYPDAEIEAIFNQDKNAYARIKGRVYPIEGEYNASEVAKIKTEQEFLDYARKNYPGESYNAEIRTLCSYSSREIISNVFDKAVGDWMFSESRVRGEITVIEGQLFRYLVYIEEPPMLTTGVQAIMWCESHVENATEEQMSSTVDQVKATLEEWKEVDGTQEGFLRYGGGFSQAFETTVRAGTFDYLVDAWMFDSSRKEGDTEVFDDSDGVYVFYYIENSGEDYDWENDIRTAKSEEEYQEIKDELLETEYAESRDDRVITQVQKAFNVKVTEDIIERQKTSNQSVS